MTKIGTLAAGLLIATTAAASAHTTGAPLALAAVAENPTGVMQEAAFAALGLNWSYLNIEVKPELLGEAMRGVRAFGMQGIILTIPHKVAVIEHLDEVDETARRIGAVNTVTRRGRHLVGSNTDWLGAVRALEREVSLAGARAVVLGAGGGARAVVYGLRARGAQVTVLNRTVAAAEALAAELGAGAAGPLDALARTPCDVLVNTTSVGLGSDTSPVAASAIAPGAVVMDAVYEPERTRLLRDAAARGARTISGRWMLVYQAAAQIETWTGLAGPVEEMARAFGPEP
jgi:shikimate dehydrogenase